VTKLHLMILCSTLALSSCGGGSSFNGGSPNAGAGLGLTSANAADAAGVSYELAFASASLADVGSNIGIVSAAPGAAPTAATKPQISGFLVNVLNQAPFGPDVFPCAISGSMTISGDIADPLTLTAGDAFSVAATACDDGIGEIVDGLISLTISDFTGDLPSGRYLLGMNAILDSFQVTTANDVVSRSGDASIALDTTASPFVSASVSGTSMATSSNASTDILNNYSTQQTVNAGLVPAPYTLSSRGTVDSSRLGDVVSFTTPVQFVGDDADFPHTGELLITGSNSSVRLIALDNVNVRIELDNDGNGSVDVTVETTWAALAT